MNHNISQSLMHMSFTREQKNEVFLRHTALVLCALFAFIYIYLASMSVFHAIVERSVVNSIEEKRSQLAALEHDYFLLSKQINPDAAARVGLQKAENRHFVSRSVRVAAGN
jgi:hypothetical protein